MRTRLIVFLIVIFGSSNLWAKPPFASDDELNTWLTYYYLNPRPDLAVASLSFLNSAMVKFKNRSLADYAQRGGIRSFYAKIFEANESVVLELETSLKQLPSDVQVFAREALRRCASTECIRVLGSASSVGSQSSLSPSTFDDSWAAFMATGDSSYVKEVVIALPLVEVRGDTERLLTGGAARWSLQSNAYQHSEVLKVLEQSALTAEPTTKRLLLEVISEAKAERAKNPPLEPIRKASN
jgi:hypothetical protein